MREADLIYLEPLILEDSLDGSIFPARSHLGLKHDTEGAIAHDLALGVGDLLGFASQSILDLLPDDLWTRSVVSRLKRRLIYLTTHAQSREQSGSIL